MFKNLVQLYSIFICLIAAIILMFTSALIINSITDLTLTAYKNKHRLVNFESNEKYIERYMKTQKPVNNKDKFKDMTEDEIKNHRLLAKEGYIEKVRGIAIKDLINYAGWFIVSLLFFISHWYLYKSDRKVNS